MPALTPDPAAQTLRLWLPPQFAPSADTPGGRELIAQLASFEQAHGWRVEVRVKKLAGQGGLLDALRTSLQVAPGASPDVIALDNSMLAAAEAVQPLTQITNEEAADFYPFALQSVRRDEVWVALPFAADALGLAYSTAVYPLPPQTWNDLKPDYGSIALPFNDPLALITLQQYLALGGKFEAKDRPGLNAPVLAQVLSDYQALETAGLLPAGTFGVTSAEEAWIAYREGRANSAATFFSYYLTDRYRVIATAFTLLPARAGAQTALARQWNYALIVGDPARQAAALELMRWLTRPDNLGAWAFAASVLPTRPQALNAWNDPELTAAADQILKAAQPEPPQSMLVLAGPPVTAAVQAVLNRQTLPEIAAAAAAAEVAVAGK